MGLYLTVKKGFAEKFNQLSTRNGLLDVVRVVETGLHTKSECGMLKTRILEIGKDETVDFIRGDGNGGHHVESRMAELENKDVSLSHY